jgi:hypothetical protein
MLGSLPGRDRRSLSVSDDQKPNRSGSLPAWVPVACGGCRTPALDELRKRWGCGRRRRLGRQAQKSGEGASVALEFCT